MQHTVSVQSQLNLQVRARRPFCTLRAPLRAGTCSFLPRRNVFGAAQSIVSHRCDESHNVASCFGYVAESKATVGNTLSACSRFACLDHTGSPCFVAQCTVYPRLLPFPRLYYHMQITQSKCECNCQSPADTQQSQGWVFTAIAALGTQFGWLI